MSSKYHNVETFHLLPAFEVTQFDYGTDESAALAPGLQHPLHESAALAPGLQHPLHESAALAPEPSPHSSSRPVPVPTASPPSSGCHASTSPMNRHLKN